MQVPRVWKQKADWSSGQDAALSRRKQGFDSPISCLKKVLAFFKRFIYNKFVAESSKIWLIGQAVKTPPSHGGNRGSIPLLAVS